mmetsp:Transcript_46369/g.112421  ORF Transcript_46369/g.112421 Transcript_46369/m.112421 type:complete len:106 (-) Transcript_46369:2007-2324(-)
MYSVTQALFQRQAQSIPPPSATPPKPLTEITPLLTPISQGALIGANATVRFLKHSLTFVASFSSSHSTEISAYDPDASSKLTLTVHTNLSSSLALDSNPQSVVIS